MKGAQIEVGKSYAVKVSGVVVAVKVTKCIESPGHSTRSGRRVKASTRWEGVSEKTGRTITIDGAARFRYEITDAMRNICNSVWSSTKTAQAGHTANEERFIYGPGRAASVRTPTGGVDAIRHQDPQQY